MTSLEEYLRSKGFNAISAGTWAAVVTAVVDLLIKAQVLTKDPANWADYCAAKGSLGKCRKRGAYKGHRIPGEEGISGELLHFMRELRKNADSNSVLRKYDIAFEGEGRVRSKRKRGKHCDRRDIHAYSNVQDGPELVFEAKVLEKGDRIRDKLLGEKGLGCFTKIDPYSRSEMGCMLAYVVDEDADHWLAAIKSGYEQTPPLVPVVTAVEIAPLLVPASCALVPRECSELPIVMLNLALRFDTAPC